MKTKILPTLIAVGAAWVLLGPVPSQGAQNPATPAQIVNDFKIQVVIDPAVALREHCNAAAARQFEEIGKGFLPSSVGVSGWQLFFSSVVYTIAPAPDGQWLAFFYHPWSDTALMTYWTIGGEKPAITRVELALGDCVRQFGKPPYDLPPLWESEMTDLTPVLSVQMAVGETFEAFQKMYPPEGDPKTEERAAFDRACKDKTTIQVMRAVAALRLGRNIDALSRYINDKSFAPYQEYADLILEDLSKGKVDRIKATIPETEEDALAYVKQQSRQIGMLFRVSAVLKTPQDCFVFLNYPGDGNVVVVLWMQTDKGKYGLRQICLVNQAMVVSNYGSIKGMIDLLKGKKNTPGVGGAKP